MYSAAAVHQQQSAVEVHTYGHINLYDVHIHTAAAGGTTSGGMFFAAGSAGVRCTSRAASLVYMSKIIGTTDCATLATDLLGVLVRTYLQDN